MRRGFLPGIQGDPSHRAHAPSSLELSMKLDSIDPTSTTLLDRVGASPRDQVAWARFVGLYGPKIRVWCRRWGLQAADVEDVTQDVLLRLAQKLGAFRYDPTRSFRGWLHTVTHNVLAGFIADRKRQCSGSGDEEVLKQLESVEARDDLVQHLKDPFDAEIMAMACAAPGAGRGPDVGGLPAHGLRGNLRRRRGGPAGNEPRHRLQGQEPRPGVPPRGDQAARRTLN